MKRVWILLGTFVFASVTSAWSATPSKEASADSYLKLFIASGIECGVTIEDATHGDFGLPDPKKTDVYSKCSPSNEVRKVSVRVNGVVSEGKRSDTYFLVSTRNWDIPSLKKYISRTCERGDSPQGTMAILFARDAQFTVVSQGGLGKEWADQAIKVVETSLGGLRACAFLEANPNFGKMTDPSTTKSSPGLNKKTSPTPKATGKKSNAESTITCRINGKSYKIVGVDPKCPQSGATSNGNSPSVKPSASSLSEADKYASAGCKTFPSAIVRLQNASGASYNQAFIAAQEAAFNLSQAGRLDSKYQILSNAQFIIIQYAQAVGWGGRGYNGDVNAVKTAIATLNSGCNSSLSIK